MLRTARFVLPAVSVFLLAICVGTTRAAEPTPTGGALPAWSVCSTIEAVSEAANECSDEAIQEAFDALGGCERPHRSNFYLSCNEDGGISILIVICDVW